MKTKLSQRCCAFVLLLAGTVAVAGTRQLSAQLQATADQITLSNIEVLRLVKLLQLERLHLDTGCLDYRQSYTSIIDNRRAPLRTSSDDRA